MCCSARREGFDYRQGARIPVINCSNGKHGSAEWSGFAQSERSLWWRKNGETVDVLINMDSFVEHGYRFKVPTKNVHGLGIKKDILINTKLVARTGSVKMLTRPALNDFEKGIHHRWPVIRLKSGGMYIFSPNDIIGKEK